MSDRPTPVPLEYRSPGSSFESAVEIARLCRSVIALIAMLLLCSCVGNGVLRSVQEQSDGSDRTIGFIVIGLSILQLVFLVVLIVRCWKLSARVGWGGATALLSIVPLINLIYWLLLVRRSNRAASEAGIPVGFLGPKV